MIQPGNQAIHTHTPFNGSSFGGTEKLEDPAWLSKDSLFWVVAPIANIGDFGESILGIFTLDTYIYIYIWVLGKIRAPWDCIY